MLVREAIITYKTYKTGSGRNKPIMSPADVHTLAAPWVKGKMQEHFFVILLDAKNRYMSHVLVSIGTLNSTIVHPREVFSPAVLERAATVILMHNHPSQDVTPSAEDKAITHRLCAAGEILGIDILDHLIICDESYYSFRDNGDM